MAVVIQVLDPVLVILSMVSSSDVLSCSNMRLGFDVPIILSEGISAVAISGDSTKKSRSWEFPGGVFSSCKFMYENPDACVTVGGGSGGLELTFRSIGGTEVVLPSLGT